MLKTYPADGRAKAGNTGVVWFDLLDATEQERSHVEGALGETLPTREQIGSIALSDRLHASEKIVRMNLPGFVRSEDGQGNLTPLAFVLTPRALVTLRYAKSESFDRYAQLAEADATTHDAPGIFAGLVQAIVDVAADRMESLSTELSQLSRAIFSDRRGHASMLRGALFQVGRMQRQITQVRAAMLGLQRAVKFIYDQAPDWLQKAERDRLHVALTDLQALCEFDQQFSDKVQFILDAVLGFINNDQNDTIKVLTVVSVVTIPPIILAGIWGMNFKSEPEYDWAHGYVFALSMIVLSMLIPLLWLKWKKWI